MRLRPSGLLADRRGFAAGEFALVLPVMLALTFGTFELSKYYQASNQVVQVANMIGQMVSQLPAQAATAEVQKILGASPTIAPASVDLAAQLGRAGWDDVLSVTVTGVAFVKTDATCASDCDYEAKVAWSIGADPMACKVLEKTLDGAPNKAGTVPAALVTNGSAIFVDARLDYAATFGTSFIPPSTIGEGAWLRPRNPTMTLKLSGSALPAPAPASTLCPVMNS